MTAPVAQDASVPVVEHIDGGAPVNMDELIAAAPTGTTDPSKLPPAPDLTQIVEQETPIETPVPVLTKAKRKPAKKKKSAKKRNR